MGKKSGEKIIEYFRHDYHARNNLKFSKLIKDYGMAGLGVYWCIVEMLYEEGGSIMHSQCDGIADALHCDAHLIKCIINDYNLFDTQNNPEKFGCEKISERLNERNEKSKKAAKAAKKKWILYKKNRDANAKRTQSERNAIIEENRIEENRIDKKEIIKEKISEKTEKFYQSLVPFVEKYGKETIREFYDYWIEPSKSGKQLRFEAQKFFDVGRRLATWRRKSDEKNFVHVEKNKSNHYEPGKFVQ